MDEERTTSGPDSPGTTPRAPKKAATTAVRKATGRAPAKAAGEPPAKSAQAKNAEPAKKVAKKAVARKVQPAKTAAKQASASKAPARKAEPVPAAPTKAQARNARPAQAEPAKETAAKETAAKAPAKKAPAKKAPANKAAKSTANKAAAKKAAAERAPAPVAGEPAASQPVRQPTPPGAVHDQGATLAVRPRWPELSAWLDALTDLARHPGRPESLERLAALAVAHLGPRAHAWADWLRDTYPTAPPAGIARLAARRAATTGRRLGMFAATGPLGALLPFPATEWARATLVLRIAAAYGHDPSDPRRVPELLHLLELRTSGGPTTLRHAVNRAGWRLGRLLAVRLVVGKGRAAGAVRAAIALADQDEEMERLAHRAMLHYRGNPRPPRQRTPADRTPADQGRFSVSRNSA